MNLEAAKVMKPCSELNPGVWPEPPRPRVLGLSLIHATRQQDPVELFYVPRGVSGCPSPQARPAEPDVPHAPSRFAAESGESTDLCCFSQIRFRGGTPTFRMSYVRERSGVEGIGSMWYRRPGRNGPPCSRAPGENAIKLDVVHYSDPPLGTVLCDARIQQVRVARTKHVGPASDRRVHN